MTKAIVLLRGRGLENSEIRSNIVRIPEVSLKIKEAQKVLDQLHLRVDLMSLMISSNDVFSKKTEIKKLLGALVQIGLFERCIKSNGDFKFVIMGEEDEALFKVSVGQISLREFIEESSVVQAKGVVNFPKAQTHVNGDPILSCSVLSAHYKASRKMDDQDKQFVFLDIPACELMRLSTILVEEHLVNQLILVGPGMRDLDQEKIYLIKERAQVVDSIENDPLLGWFWSGIRRAAIGMVQ